MQFPAGLHRAFPLALSIAVALSMPALLAVNGIRVLASDWYVRFEHGRIAPDSYGLTRQERTELGLVGLRSIQPEHGDGIELLRRARLPEGGPAFGERELRHMEDVRTWIGRIYLWHLISGAAIALLAAALGLSARTRAIVPDGLAWGSVLTLAVAVAVAALVLVRTEAFFTPFHRIFFGGNTWRFADDDTLRRVFPDRFWAETAIGIGVAAVVQALTLLALTRLWRRRVPVRRSS